MIKFRQVSPFIGALIAMSSALAAVLPGLAEGQESVSIERAGRADQTPVVLVPGLATPGDVWAGTVQVLEGQMDAHIITLAGFGGEPPVERAASVMDTAVADLSAYLAEADLQDAVLVGHSMGAQIALQVAADQPGRVSRVVVVDSAPFYARLLNPSITPDQAQAYGAMMAARMGSASREQFLAMSRQGLPIQSISPDGQARILSWMEASDQATVARAMGEVMSTDFSPVLADVAVPVSVILGWSEGMPVDAPALESLYTEQYAGLDSVDFHTIDGARHFVMLDQPEAFHAVLAPLVTGGN